MSITKANRHHERARTLYRSVLINEARNHGGIANLAAKIAVPESAIHNALDGKGGYTALRNMAHEVERKLDIFRGEAAAERWKGVDADKYLETIRGTEKERLGIERLQADMAGGASNV